MFCFDCWFYYYLILPIFLHRQPVLQDLKLEDIHFKRILMGGFPSYSKKIPLRPKFDRIIQIGDASSVQSPLSFGGFGALIKHLPRLSQAIGQALSENKLRSRDLALINTYLPSLSVCWLFQRAMALRIGQQKASESSHSTGWLPANHINKLMLCNFAAMSFLGRKVIQPFLQDSMQAGPLAATMLGMLLQDPITISRVLFQVGPTLILTWFLHFFALISYSTLHLILSPFRNVIKSYKFQRMLDALEWGSGLN
jgi:lycopene cyclase CruP